MSDTKEMTAHDKEMAYWAANNNEQKALDYQVANGTINAEDAITEVANEPKKPETPKEQAEGGAK